MIKAIWNWICSLFSSETIGIIWEKLFTATKNKVVEIISDPETQQAAWDIAKMLCCSDMTNEQKREHFNQELKEWAKAEGKELTEAAINALRENAIVALKGE